MDTLRIAHLINPVKVDEDIDLHFQQPFTFESMKYAKEFSKDIEVEQFACFYPEDESMVPDDFTKVDPLEESTEGKFEVNRKLPYFKEMLDKLYEASDADYFIQTNADIGLQPYFYNLVKALIEDGNDSFCITKRVLPEWLKETSLPVIYGFIGGQHAGHDCFVFRRGIYPRFEIGEICMGTPWSETTIITSMIAFAGNFKIFNHAHATWHLGDRRIWIGHEYNDYRIHNTNEFARTLKKLSKKNKKILKHEATKIQLVKLKNEVMGYSNEVYSKDCWDLIS